ncbi:MAG: hypothetical protein KAR39_11190 [Thermoplasmata archaeon]|nr:hypothetical protein [Thermoplasmata archaeon]
MTEETEPEDVKSQEEEDDKLTVHTLFSILVLLTGIFLLPTSGFVFWLLSGSLFEIFPVITVLLGLLAVCGILEIIGSIGLFKKKPWARILTIWVVFIAFLLFAALITNVAAFGATYGVGIADVPTFAVPVFIMLLGPMMIHLTIFAYFFTKEGKEPFAPSPTE